MKREILEDIILSICKKSKLKLLLHQNDVEPNNGYAIYDEVHLGKYYDTILIYSAVAFHEIGHAIINVKRYHKVDKYEINSMFNEEFMAWDLALKMYYEFVKKPFSRSMCLFMLNCLVSHAKSDRSFKDIKKLF